MDSLIGLKDVKEQVRRFSYFARMCARRKQEGLPDLSLGLHMVFTGNPGTGKTTVARFIGEILHQNGLLSKGHIVETDRASLVGQYIGHSEKAISDKLAEAAGGVLFIDEFYGLLGTGNDFGVRVIDVLVKAMEDKRGDLCVIAAGYPDLMEKTIQSNPGLRSRFSRTIHFPDYEPDDLIEIIRRLLIDKKYGLTQDAVPLLKEIIQIHYAKRDKNFGNARDMRNFFERITEVQACRIDNPGYILTVIRGGDIKEAATLAKLNT